MSSGVARKAFDAGFRHFGPVSPPGAPGILPKDAGKAPAGKNEKTGQWYNMAVQQFRCRDAATADLWDSWAANLGLACGRAWNLYGKDLDIEDGECMEIAIEAFSKRLGPDMLIRGVSDPNHKRCLIPFKVVGPMTKGSNMTFIHPNGVKVQIDGLWEGKQFVAAGIHPGTLTRYAWSPVDPFDHGPSIFPSMTVQELQETLDEIEEAFKLKGVLRSSTKVSVLGPAIKGSAHYPVVGTRHEVESLMALMPKADDPRFANYIDWLAWCFHIMAASNRADWGRNLWLEWCSPAPQEPGLPEAKWDDTPLRDVRSNGVTSIRKWLKQNLPGPLAALEYAEAPPLDFEEIEESAGPNLLMPRLQRRWVYDMRSDRIIDVVSGIDYTKAAIDARYVRMLGSLRGECGFSDPKKGPKTVSALFLGHADTRMVTNLTYWPGESQVFETLPDRPLLNLWTPGARLTHPHVVDTDIQPYLDHCTLVLRDPAYVILWLKWCAYVIQFPNRKPNWHWLIMSLPGLGKDFMLRPLIHGVGVRNHQSINAGTLASDFNAYLKAKLVTISEIRQVSRSNKSASDVFNDLKMYMARPPDEVPINEKGLRPYKIPNLSAWVMLSNSNKPLALEKDDRRVFVAENFQGQILDATHYAYVDKWLTGNVDLIASYLLRYSLTDADFKLIEGHAPMTGAKQALGLLSLSVLEQAVAMYIKDAKAGVHPMVATAGDIYIKLRDQFSGYNFNAIMTGQILYDCGARPLQADADSGGRGAAPVAVRGLRDKRPRLWVLAETDDKGNNYKEMDKNQLKDVYLTGSVFPDSADKDAKVVPLRKSQSKAQRDDNEELP